MRCGRIVGCAEDEGRLRAVEVRAWTLDQGGERGAKRKPPAACGGLWLEINLATTYSRTTYRCTTIGNAVFDGRVRDGIGSDHRFMVTKKALIKRTMLFVEDYTQGAFGHFLQPGAKKPLCY